MNRSEQLFHQIEQALWRDLNRVYRKEAEQNRKAQGNVKLQRMRRARGMSYCKLTLGEE